MLDDEFNKKLQNAINEMYKNLIEASSPDDITYQYQPEHYEIKCSHDWKEYIGFTERYNYCSKCDVKENQ